MRRIVLVAAAVVAAAGIGAATWLLVAYDAITKVDRSNPKVVTDEYLRAALVRKDLAGVDLYSCEDKSDLKSIVSLREELDRRERDFGVTILVDWEDYKRVDAPGRVELTTDLTITASIEGVEQSSSKQGWAFVLKDDGGWRVCEARRVESASVG